MGRSAGFAVFPRDYAGAITYVAERIEDEKRGYYTGWLQTSPTLGIVVSLATIISIRTYLGNDASARTAWGMRCSIRSRSRRSCS